jgi:hypothetical protein
MATKTKATKKKEEQKAAQETAATDVPKVEDSADVKKSDIPDKPYPLTDMNAPIGGLYIGVYARVVSGEHKGKYGVIYEDTPGKEVLFRTRDENHEEIAVDYKDLRPALAGGR